MPGIGELFRQMPPVLTINSQVMGEEGGNWVSKGHDLASGMWFRVVTIYPLEAEVANILQERITSEHKCLLQPRMNADIMEPLIKAAKLKVVLTAGFRREGTWN